jgi:hypothetical protein
MRAIGKGRASRVRRLGETKSRRGSRRIDMAGNVAGFSAARRHGVATECGMARGDPARFPALFAAHAQTTERGVGIMQKDSAPAQKWPAAPVRTIRRTSRAAASAPQLATRSREAAPQMASSPRINTSVVRRRSFNRTSPCHHPSACSGVKALRNTSDAKAASRKLS